MNIFNFVPFENSYNKFYQPKFNLKFNSSRNYSTFTINPQSELSFNDIETDPYNNESPLIKTEAIKD